MQREMKNKESDNYVTNSKEHLSTTTVCCGNFKNMIKWSFHIKITYYVCQDEVK